MPPGPRWLARNPAASRTTASDKSADGLRKRRATANRILTVLKAALNHAWKSGHVSSDDAWRRVKPFRAVETARVRYLSDAECVRLVIRFASFRRVLPTVGWPLRLAKWTLEMSFAFFTAAYALAAWYNLGGSGL